MADLGAFFGNPNLQRQVARARALAEKRDVNTLADPRTYAAVQGLLGTAPDQMGFSVLHPDYQKIRETAEPAYALGLLAQAAPVLAPLTKGLPVGASIKNVGDDLLSYRGSHKAPNAKTYGATLDDLTKILPEDVYSQQGKQLYGIGDRIIDSEWRTAALKAKGKPDAEIEIYRAVPKGVKEINDGDWVSTSKAYAKSHGENTLNGEYDIISKKVKAKTLSTEGYPYEYGYNESASFPKQEALDTAQRNAALPVEEGGLGLPKDNTPEMRAEAMGFNTELLHGTAKDFPSFDLSKAGTNTRQAGDELGIFSTSKPFLANDYAQIASRGGWANRTEPENAVVYPLLGSFKNPKKYQTASEFYRDADAMAAEQKLGKWREQLQSEGYDSVFVRPDLEEVVAFNPNQLRSRFAAFDPMRRNEPDLLAGVLPLGLLADEEQRKKLYELVPTLLGQ